MHSCPRLSVRVSDVERKPIEKATVQLASNRQEDEDAAIALVRDGATGLFTAEVPERGRFTLVVAARGMERQIRTIELPHPAPVEFVLGRRGMPYYYRGVVKTPFDPKPDLLGVTLNAQADPEASAARLAKRFELSPVEAGEQIRRNGVRVFAYPKAAGEGQREEILQAILRDDAVQHAGPILELFEERLVFLTRQIVVKFKAHVVREKVLAYARERGLRVVRQIRFAGNAYLLEGPQRGDYRLLEIANSLAESDDVIYAEPNTVTTSMLYAVNPADFLVAQQWHIPLIELPDAWQALRDENPIGVMPGQPGDLTYGSEGVTIVVFDTGIQSSTTGAVTTPSHPDFQGNVTGGAPKVAAFYDFNNMVANNDTLALGSDHGMGCAGVATAQADNPASIAGESEGVAGAAGNCRVIGIAAPFGQPNLRWADAFVWMAGFDPGWVADGVTYPMGTTFPPTLAQGADIHTNSTRIPDVGLMDDALDYVAAYGRGGRGMVSFLAAGNTAANLSHPNNNTIADHDKVVTIAASINTDVRSGYSCFDPAIDVCAPSDGDNAQTIAGALGKVTTDTVGGGNLAGRTSGPLSYRDNFGGTSSATPLAAGVGALMLSINPNLNWVQVRELLRNTAVKIDAANTDPVGQWTIVMGNPVFSQWYGFGRIDAAAAVQAARDFGLSSDVVIRDNLADTGAVPSGGWHADSPDIWIRRTDDPIPVLGYGAAPPHQNALRGQDNYVFLRAKNVGTAETDEVYLKALICHYPGFEFRYPDEWQPSVPPSSSPPSPLVPGTYLIGEALIDDLAAGADTIVKITWDQDLIPPQSVMVGSMSVLWHPCILAEVSPHDGPSAGGMAHDVKSYNDLAHKNITIEGPGFATRFSAYGVVAGTTHSRGVNSLVLDRGGMVPQARAFVYSEDAELMSAWIELVETRGIAPAGVIPWRPEIQEPDMHGDIETEAGPRGCSVTVLDRTRLAVDCCDRSRLVIDAAPRTRLWTSCGGTAAFKPKVSVGQAFGQRVIYLEGGGADVLELPMPLPGSRFTALALGVDRGDLPAFGSLRATQRRADGELSAGYEVRG